MRGGVSKGYEDHIYWIYISNIDWIGYSLTSPSCGPETPSLDMAGRDEMQVATCGSLLGHIIFILQFAKSVLLSLYSSHSAGTSLSLKADFAVYSPVDIFIGVSTCCESDPLLQRLDHRSEVSTPI